MTRGQSIKEKMLRFAVFAGLLAAFLFSPLTSTRLEAQVRRGNVNVGNLSGSTVVNTGMNNSNAAGNPNNPFGTADSTQRDTNAVRGLVYHKETPDSVLQQQVFMFHYEPLTVKYYEVWNPDLSPTGAQFSDPLDELNGDYFLGKGLVGQPHYALFSTFADGLGDQLQPDPNEGYAKRPDNIWLYQTMTPYTTLGYQSSLDKDYQVRVSHSQNIRPGWNVAFDYNLICPQGVYTSSGVKNHYLDATTNYFSSDSRLQAVAGIIWQSFNIDENGGIADDAYFTRQLQSNRAGVPVNLYNSGTLHRETAAFGRASYNLVQQQPRYRQRDSIAVRTVADTVTVVDTVEVTDTIYPAKPRVLNAGVVGLELNYDRRKRVFLDSTLWTGRDATLFWTNDAYPDYRWENPLKVTLGVKTVYYKTAIDGRPAIESLDLFKPFTKVDVALGSSTIGGEAMLGSIGDDMEYFYSGHLELPFDSAESTVLNLTVAAQKSAPDVRFEADALLNQGLELRHQRVERYELQFVSGDWLDLMVRANHLSHNTWYDTTLTVHEGTQPFWLYQAALTTHLAAGWFHLDMQQLLQHSTDPEQMPVPLWASKNSVYAELHLFSRALTLQTGVDLRYHTAFHAQTYDYRTGLFCHQDEIDVGNYIWGDVFVNIQIKRASIYLKAGHLNALWETSPNYFILPHYPGRKFGLYWGINWKFFD